MKQRHLILTLAVLVVMVLPAVASAYPFLPKARAEHDTTTVALRSAHRIWRVSDTRIEHMGCRRFNASIELCYVTVGLHYSSDECVPPVDVSALFIIGQASRREYVWRQNKPWEVDPAGAGGCLPEEQSAGEREAEHQLDGEVAKVYREGEETATKAGG